MTARAAASDLVSPTGLFSSLEEVRELSAMTDEDASTSGFYTDLWSRDARKIATLILWALDQGGSAT